MKKENKPPKFHCPDMNIAAIFFSFPSFLLHVHFKCLVLLFFLKLEAIKKCLKMDRCGDMTKMKDQQSNSLEGSICNINDRQEVGSLFMFIRHLLTQLL